MNGTILEDPSSPGTEISVRILGTKNEHLEFTDILNQNEKNIKLTMQCSQTAIKFLDVLIFKDGRVNVQTDMYRKKTSVNALLHATSAHPSSAKRGIPTGQFMRARRICSQEPLFQEQARDLVQWLEDRGYGRSTILEGLSKASNKSRSQLLVPQKNENKTTEPDVRFITDFNNRWWELRVLVYCTLHIWEAEAARVFLTCQCLAKSQPEVGLGGVWRKKWRATCPPGIRPVDIQLPAPNREYVLLICYPIGCDRPLYILHLTKERRNNS